MSKRDDYLLKDLVALGFATDGGVAAFQVRLSHSDLANPSNDIGVVDLLISDGTITMMSVAQAKAAHFGAQVIRLDGLVIPDAVLKEIEPERAWLYKVIPVSLRHRTLTVAMSDPSDINLIDTLSNVLRRDISAVVAAEDEILELLHKHYPSGIAGAEKMRAEMDAMKHESFR